MTNTNEPNTQAVSAAQPAGAALAPITVLKFGSSVLRSAPCVDAAIGEIYRELRRGRRVVAVVSAVGDTTDHLLGLAEQVSGGSPNAWPVAQLLATGEAQSVALLALALDRAGIDARGLDAHQVALRGEGTPTDATLTSVDAGFIRNVLDEHPVAVLPGFICTDSDQRLLLTGRGGSDLSALFLAHALQAECRLIKDVDGVFEYDPAKEGAPPRRFSTLTYEDALTFGKVIVQSKAVTYAQQRNLQFSVTSRFSRGGTRIGAGTTTFGPVFDRGTLPVAVLGDDPEVAVICRRALRDASHIHICAVHHTSDVSELDAVADLPEVDSVDQLIDTKPAIVIDLRQNNADSPDVISPCLKGGAHVITAGSSTLGDDWQQFITQASEAGVRLVGIVPPTVQERSGVRWGIIEAALAELAELAASQCYVTPEGVLAPPAGAAETRTDTCTGTPVVHPVQPATSTAAAERT